MFFSENEKDFFNKMVHVKNQNEINKIFNDFNIIFEPFFNVDKLKKPNFTLYEVILNNKKKTIILNLMMMKNYIMPRNLH